MPTTMNGTNGALVAPERNNFFYGKLMDVAQFRKEQDYFNHLHQLLNRFVVGSGVVCGLDVVSAAMGMITVQPGVAMDGLGRWIILPAAKTINPRQLTNERGDPVGDPIPPATPVNVLICLAYAETCTDPVPLFVLDCDSPGACAPTTIREDARVVVSKIVIEPPSGAPTCALPNGFPADIAELHGILCEDRSNSPCPQPPGGLCVPLAKVKLDRDVTIEDKCALRSLVYGNRLLYELIICLAQKVQNLEQEMKAREAAAVEVEVPRMVMHYVAGDGQKARRNEPLDEPLVVEITDSEGKPLADRPVQFEVTAGGGAVKPATKKTTQRGLAQTRWTLGPEKGEQRVIASAEGTNFTVTFRATAV